MATLAASSLLATTDAVSIRTEGRSEAGEQGSQAGGDVGVYVDQSRNVARLPGHTGRRAIWCRPIHMTKPHRRIAADGAPLRERPTPVNMTSVSQTVQR